MLKIFKWLVLPVLFALLAWRIVAVNVSAHYAAIGTGPAADIALSFASANADAMLRKALALRDSDPAQARQLLKQAIPAQPVNGRLFSTLGHLLEQQGQGDRAVQAMAIAEQLAPRQSAVQADLAGFWGGRNDAERYLRHLVKVMELNRNYRDETHPALLAMFQNPAYFEVVRRVFSEAIADEAPEWVTRFIEYAVQQPQDLTSLRLLYSIRSGSPAPWSQREQRLFLHPLLRVGQYTEAYFVWLNSLDEAQLSQLGNLFNGSFETPLMNQGFGWVAPRREGISVGIAATQGVSDRTALRVRFRKKVAPGSYATQFLMLPAGTYQFSGRVRVDRIPAEQGLHWRLDCVTPIRRTLARTEEFSGSQPWRSFSLEVEVPGDQCPVQQLLLVGRGGYDAKAAVSMLWSDDLGLRSLE